CRCKDVIFLANQNRWQCRNKHFKRQFSLKTGTIYEDSPLGLDKWLTATWLVTNCKNGVSSCEIARALNITQKTAWFMDHRIRVSLGMETPDKLSGHGHYRLSNYRHQQSRRESFQVFRNTMSPRFIVGNRRVQFLRPK